MFQRLRKGMFFSTELFSRRDSVAQHLLPKAFISTLPFHTEKIRCQGMQSQISLSIQLLMNSFPGLLHPSLPSPLHVDNSGHDSSHSLLPVSPAADTSLLLLCSGLSYLSVVPALSQPKYKTPLSYALMFLHNVGYRTQMLHFDNTLRDESEAKISLAH